MSRQFSIPTFLRGVPNDLLGQFFSEVAEEDFQINWKDLKKRETEPVTQVLNQLSLHQRNQIESIMRDIFDLSDERGVNAILEAAVLCGFLNLKDELPQDEGFYAKAMSCWLNFREVFDKALVFHEIDTQRWWRKRNDLPKVNPDTSELAVTRLQKGISDLLVLNQGRGQNCTVETMSRNDTTYFCASPDDFVQNSEAHDVDRKLTPITIRPTFSIVFAFTPSEGSLELASSTVPANLKRKLELIFAIEILGQDIGPWNPDAAFDLNHLKQPEFRLETDPVDSLNVWIRKMRLQPMNSRRRIHVEIDDDDPNDDIHKTLSECLNPVGAPLSGCWISQVTFCFQFLPKEGRKSGQRSIDVSYPSSCNLRNERPERVELIRKYLKRWKVDRVRSDEISIDPTAA